MAFDSFLPPTLVRAADQNGASAAEPQVVYVSRKTWNVARPHVLVVACSDGRLQENVDDFLSNHLGINGYDRLFMPGGPGALSQSGYEFLRSDQWRRECAFLIAAHGIQELVLIFHGAACDGPETAICADYPRKLPSQTPSQVREQQEIDALDLLRRVFSVSSQLRVRIFRAEVRADGFVQFVDLIRRDETL